MKVTPSAIPEVLILEPQVFGDDRGFFFESFNARKFEELTGVPGNFVQDNHSKSARNVLRGLHYQIRQPQGKLVRVAQGAIYDVVVDMRRSSPFFGRWVGVELSSETGANYGCHRALRTASWLPARAPNACTRPPTTGRPSMSVRYCGTIPSSASTGR